MVSLHLRTNAKTTGAQRIDHERGAVMVEYTLLVALLVVVAIVSLRELGNTTANQFVAIAAEVSGIAP